MPQATGMTMGTQPGSSTGALFAVGPQVAFNTEDVKAWGWYALYGQNGARPVAKLADDSLVLLAMSSQTKDAKTAVKAALHGVQRPIVNSSRGTAICWARNLI